MSILQEIQAEILGNKEQLGTILLKMRFLASRLGSEALEDWVKYETEGYPATVEVPEYRVVGVTYTGTWSGPWNSGINNAPIPGYLIEQFAGERWTRYEVRESIAGVEALTEDSDARLGIDASNLILLLQGKIYEGYACNSISASLSMIAMREIKQTVRTRLLELTLELEKRLPEALEVTLQQAIANKPDSEATVTQIFNQTVYGTLNNLSASSGGQVNLSITSGDLGSLRNALIESGLPDEAAKEFSDIVANEEPEDDTHPGKNALEWIKANAPKATSGAWKIGSSVVTSVLTDAALKYYGLKP